MMNLWCSLHQGKNLWKKSVNLPHAEFLHKFEEEVGLQLGKSHLPKTPVSGQKKSILGSKPDGEALRSITHKLSNE